MPDFHELSLLCRNGSLASESENAGWKKLWRMPLKRGWTLHLRKPPKTHHSRGSPEYLKVDRPSIKIPSFSLQFLHVDFVYSGDDGGGGGGGDPASTSDLPAASGAAGLNNKFKADLDYCLEKTHFDEKTVREWQKSFHEECPSGKLTKTHLHKLFKQVIWAAWQNTSDWLSICEWTSLQVFPIGDSETFCNHIFRVFDDDGSNTLDFKVN